MMKHINAFTCLLSVGLLLSLIPPVWAQSRRDANEAMFSQMQSVRGLRADQIQKIREIFAQSDRIGQGNPWISKHPLSPQEAALRIGKSIRDVQKTYRNKEFERICGGPFVVPLYDPKTQRASDAQVCMDMFEYPNVPMEYPVTWVSPKHAAMLCAAEGKRISDAHEWEGAAAGQLLPPDYPFQMIKGLGMGAAVNTMRAWHNQKYANTANQYSIGQWKAGVCATASSRTAGCDGGSYSKCGSNTYPSGSFPNCKSKLGVYDIDGNVAEQMNLPLTEEQMASRGSKTLGVTELKGSWFIWDAYRAHEHWARWRAPFWHGTRFMDNGSHSNYHLGFRCARDIR